MPLEDLVGSNKYLDDLVKEWPLGIDPQAEGDDHIRGVKNVLLNTFGSLTEAVDWQLWAPRRKGAVADTYETGSLDLPSGSTANRPAAPINGTMRLGETGFVEMWDGSNWINKFAHPEKNNDFSVIQRWLNQNAIQFRYEPTGQDWGANLHWYYGDPLETWLRLKAGGDAAGVAGDAALALDMRVAGIVQTDHFKIGVSSVELAGNKLLTEATRPYSQSTLQAYTNGGVISYSHGLGVRAVSVQAFAVCQSGEHGYVSGQEIAIDSHTNRWQQDTSGGSGTNAYYGLTTYVPDDNNVAARIGPDGIAVFDRNTSAFGVLTPANWQIRLRAWG